MTNRQVKEDIIAALFERGVYTKQVNDTEFRTRCPFCGDSQKNFNTGHMYIKINLEDNLPIVWNCFKCNEHGILTSDVLSMLEINNVDLRSELTSMNKTSDKLSAYKFLNNVKTIVFEYELPEIQRGKKTKYIEDRLGIKLGDDDLKKMKVITSFRDFLIKNNIRELLCDSQMAFRIEDHFVGFLSYGNSHILFRDISEKDNFRWVKYPITEDSKQCRLFYSMEATVDLFTEEKITINLAEGVMDIASACFNLGYEEANTMNIAVCGKRYDTVINYLTTIGFVGDNIVLNIFADNDAMFNKGKNNKPLTINYFRKMMKKYKHLYGEVNVFYNEISKDIGVTRDKISLKKEKL